MAALPRNVKIRHSKLRHAKIRLGIVGAGKHGSRYAAHAARDIDGLELVAVCRRDQSKGSALAEELGCDYEADVEKLLARSDIDAVVLCTIPRLLPRFVEMAIAGGKRLIIEKPVARTLDEGLATLRLIEASGVYCLTGHTLRMNTAMEALRRELPSLGRLDSISFSQRFPAQLQLEWLDTPEESGGGSILHTGVHCFDLIFWLTGCSVTTAAAIARSVYTRRTEDHFASVLTTSQEGLLAQVACSRSTHSRNGLVEATGEHGQLIVDHVQGTGYRLGPKGREDWALDAPRMTVKALLERFVDEVQRDAEPSIPYREALAAVAVADACYRSIETGAFEAVRALPPR